MDAEHEAGPPLVVQTQRSEGRLPAGPSYLVGRHPDCAIVMTDARVSWRHAVLRLEGDPWEDVLALILTATALVVFVFAATGSELHRFNEIALGLVLLTAALICQFTSTTDTHIGR